MSGPIALRIREQAGWTTVALSEAAQIVNGGTPKSNVAKYWGGDVQWLTPKDMGRLERREIATTPRTISKDGLANSSARLVPKNSVILSTRAPIGHLAINTAPMAFNQGCRGIVPTAKLDHVYLYYFLQANRKLLDDLGAGTTFKELSATNLKAVRIPLPPLEEQKRIVAVLDDAFAALDRARTHAEANLADVAELFVKVALDNLEAVAENGQLVPVGSIAQHCLGKMLDKHKNKGILSRYLRNLNVRWFGVDTSDVLEMKIEDRERERFSVRKGDLLVCEGGYPGRASIYESEECIYFQKALHRVRFDNSALAKILMYWLYVEDQTGKLKTHFSGTGIAHFTGQTLHSYPMPLSSDERNEECVRNIEQCRDETAVLADHYQQRLADIADLRQSILQKAFAGQLT